MDIWRLLLIVRYSNFWASGRAQNTLIRRRTTASSATDKRSLLIPIRSYRRTSMHLTACGSLTRIPLWDRNPLNLCLKQIESGFFYCPTVGLSCHNISIAGLVAERVEPGTNLPCRKKALPLASQQLTPLQPIPSEPIRAMYFFV